MVTKPRMQSRYNLSFTAASLRPELMRIAAEIFLASDSWDLTQKQILSTNAFQCRSSASAARLEMELRQRLELLTPAQLKLLAEASVEDRTAMAWLAACKRSGFIFEFATAMLREKLSSHDSVLRLSDYESFVDLQALSHAELEALSPSSKTKIRQVVFNMLTESGMLSAGATAKQIHRPVLSPPAFRAIVADDPQWLACFLVPDNEIPRL